MARSSYSARSRRRRRTNSIYLAVAVVVCAVVVFFLFRGDASVSGEDATGADVIETVSVAEPVRATPRMAAEADSARQPAPVPEERSSQPLPQAAGRQVASLPTRRPEMPEAAPPAENLPSPSTPAAAPAEVHSSAAVDRAIAEARALLDARPREVVAARDKFNAALSMEMSPAQRRTVKSEMAKLAEEWLFNPSAYAGDTLCGTYTVKRGDLLQVIGRKHKVPFEILMKINNIPRPQSLQAGKAIKVIHGPFHAKVSRSTFTLDLYLKDTYVRSFKVGLGRPGYETPTGLWRVQEGGKLEAPRWTDPDSGRVYTATDPDYPLGSRWIALDGVSGNAKGRTGFAIHGTKEPEQIGAAGSRGCIRMYNGEAILVYNMLFPLYSKVEVFD